MKKQNLFFWGFAASVSLLVLNRLHQKQNTPPQNTSPQPTHVENTAFQGSYTPQNTSPQNTPQLKINTCNGETASAALRNSPNENAQSISVLTTGSAFIPKRLQDGFVLVESSGKTGWIRKCFVEGSL